MSSGAPAARRPPTTAARGWGGALPRCEMRRPSGASTTCSGCCSWGGGGGDLGHPASRSRPKSAAILGADTTWAVTSQVSMPDRKQLSAARARQVLYRALRRFFEEHGYSEVETPILIPTP